MPANRLPRSGEVAGLAALGVAVCCGLPVVLSVGAGITIAGLGLRCWLLAAAGLVPVAAGTSRYRRQPGGALPGDHRSGR